MMPSNGRGTHHHLLKDEMGDGPVNMLPDHNLEKIFITDHEHSAIKYMSFSGKKSYGIRNKDSDLNVANKKYFDMNLI